jgi:hypothetical protein
MNIEIADILTIAAILAAPFAAVWVQRTLDRERERRNDKRILFGTLMATRAVGARTSAEHVRGLNLIDIVFGGPNQSSTDKAVTDAWRVYLDALDVEGTDDEERIARIVASDDKFVELLYQMAKALRFEFDRSHLRKGVYSPMAHATAEQRGLEMQARLASVLGGERAILVRCESRPVGGPSE